MSDETMRERIANVGAGVTPTYYATESVEEAKAVVDQCMTATDELRRLLDEHAVEYQHNECTKVFYWDCDGANGETAWFTATEVDGGINMMASNLTPEQAVEATMGRGECRNDSLKRGAGVFVCSECGAYLDIADMDEEDMDVFYEPSFCPSCGKKVVDE